MTLETKRFMLLFEVQLHICHCFSALLRKKFSSVTLKCKPSLMCKHTVDLCFSCFYQTAVNSSLRALWLRPPANVLRGVHWPWLTFGFSNSYKRADFLLKAQLTSLKCFCTFKPALKKTPKNFCTISIWCLFLIPWTCRVSFYWKMLEIFKNLQVV